METKKAYQNRMFGYYPITAVDAFFIRFSLLHPENTYPYSVVQQPNYWFLASQSNSTEKMLHLSYRASYDYMYKRFIYKKMIDQKSLIEAYGSNGTLRRKFSIFAASKAGNVPIIRATVGESDLFPTASNEEFLLHKLYLEDIIHFLLNTKECILIVSSEDKAVSINAFGDRFETVSCYLKVSNESPIMRGAIDNQLKSEIINTSTQVIQSLPKAASPELVNKALSLVTLTSEKSQDIILFKESKNPLEKLRYYYERKLPLGEKEKCFVPPTYRGEVVDQ